MFRRNYLIVTAALAACVVPATAAAQQDHRIEGMSAAPVQSADVQTTDVPPPSSIAASAADEYEQLRQPDVPGAVTGRGPHADRTQVELGRPYGSPDAADAARQLPQTDSKPSVLARSYGSPDAADAARQLPQTDSKPSVLARSYGSPDAADAARDVPPVQIPTPVVEVRDAPSGGFDWGDAGIGAAGMFGLFGIAAGSALLLTGRKRRQGVQVATH
jgi:hypothetical protein